MVRSYKIKIPKELQIFYSEHQKLVLVHGPFQNTILRLPNKLNLSIFNCSIYLTNSIFNLKSKNLRKKLHRLQLFITTLIKQVLLEASSFLCKKFQFVGVGYKVFLVNQFNKNILLLRLGLSHLLYLKIPVNLNVYCFKCCTKVYVYSHNFKDLLKICTILRALRKPEPYKGKGILYENENIKIKEGKKI